MFKAWKKPLLKSKSKAKTEDTRTQASEGNGFHNQTISDSKASHNLPAISLAFESLSVSDTHPCRPHISSAEPTNSEVAKNGEDIKKPEETVTNLDLEHEDPNRRAEHAHQEQEASVKQASTSHIHRLPHDILVIIFILHVRYNQQSPWLLVQINQVWRRSAFSTGPIWACIEVAPIACRAYPRYRGGRETCVTYEQLQRAVARAKGTALDLRFNSESPSSFHKEGQSEWNVIISCFRYISDRITVESLAIVGPSFWWYKPFIIKLNPSKLQVLRLLHIGEDVFGHWEETAKKLRVLELGTSVLSHANHRQVWWKNLEQLIFTNTSLTITSEQYKQIQVILKWTTSLRILEFNRCSFGPPSNEVISSPGLQELRLRRQYGSSVVDAPNIKSLILDHASFCRDTEYRYLTHLEVAASRPRYSGPLHSIFAPSLHTLILSGESAATWWPLGGGGPLPNPIVLRLHNVRINPSDFVNTLYAMTQLEEIYFELVDMTIPLIDTFDVIFSHLQVINIIGGVDVDIKSLAGLIKPMLQFRAEAGFPLREAKIRTLNSDKWLDLLS